MKKTVLQAVRRKSLATLRDFDSKGFTRDVKKWFHRYGRSLPWRETTDPYAIWVSEAMLQQTQVAAVVNYFRKWMILFPTVEALAAAEESDVLRTWEGLGYYSRARNLHQAAKLIAGRLGGKLPSSPDELAKLPGIGRYSAGAVAAFAFDLPVPVVDTNIARVLARVFEISEPVDDTDGREAIWHAAAVLAETGGGRAYTSAIMELGALLCTPKKPHCLLCPVRTYCRAEKPESLPVKRPRMSITRREEACAVTVEGGSLLLERSVVPRWKGLWHFPEIPIPANEKPIAEIVYPITRYRVTLRAYPAMIEHGKNKRWFRKTELSSIGMPVPHRRLLEKLEQSAHLTPTTPSLRPQSGRE